MGLADTAKLAVQLDLKGNFTGQLRSSQAALSKFDAQVSATANRAYKAGQQVGTGFRNAGRLIAGGATIAGGALLATLKIAGDFEGQLNTINTIARANSKDLGVIGESIRKVARDTGTSLDDLTTGYYDLLSAGIKAADAQKVLTEANKLAIGGLSTTAESIDLLTTAINVYGGDASKAAEYADIFAKAIERGQVTAADLAATFAQVGPIAAASGLDIKELAAAYAQLTATGVPAAEAATQTRSAIVALTKVNPELEKLQKQTGRTYLSIAGKQGLVVALEQMRKDAAKAGVPLIDLLGRVEGLNFTLATTGPNFAGYVANLDAMGKAAGTAAGQMAERQKGLNFQLSILKAKVQDAAIVIGSSVLPKITPIFERLNKALSDPKVISQIQAFGDSIAGLFSDKNLDEGARVLSDVFATAKAAAPVVKDAAIATLGAVKAAVGLFTSLPPEVQQLAVGAFAINKITGGLVTNVAGGLISSVLKQLVSGVVNVSGAVVNVVGAGGVPGVPPGAPVPAGTSFIDALKTAIVRAGPAAFLGTTGVANSLGVLDNKNLADAEKRRIKELMAAGLTLTEAFKQAQRELASGALRADEQFGPPSPVAFRRAGGDRTKDDRLDSAQLLRGTNALLSDGFRMMVDQLRGAKSNAAIQAAVAATVKKVVTEGRGNVGSTQSVLASLKAQLKTTHDPKTAAIIRSAISKVEAKLPGRQFAAAQLSKADAILKSNESGTRKIDDLKTIQRSLLTHGLPAAAAQINARIDAAKRDQVYATRAATEAIKDKDLSVKVNNTVNVNARFSVADVTRGTVRLSRYGNVAF